MKPIGPLMIEHRLIERMVALLKGELAKLEEGKELNPEFIFNAVDFFRTYADQLHHGKEEDILFKELAKKQISEEHKKIMQELIEQHIIARKNVKGLLEANEKYVKNHPEAIKNIISFIKALIELYPPHIAKEDKQFFLPILGYFSEEEQRIMLKQFFEFDKQMIHKKYAKVVEQYE